MGEGKVGGGPEQNPLWALGTLIYERVELVRLIRFVWPRVFQVFLSLYHSNRRL